MSGYCFLALLACTFILQDSQHCLSIAPEQNCQHTAQHLMCVVGDAPLSESCDSHCTLNLKKELFWSEIFHGAPKHTISAFGGREHGARECDIATPKMAVMISHKKGMSHFGGGGTWEVCFRKDTDNLVSLPHDLEM